MARFIEYNFITTLLKASGQASVLILLVLVAQWVVGRRLNPRWRFALWLLVVIRLALPWSISSRASLFNLLRIPPATSSLFASAGIPASQESAAAQAESLVPPAPLDRISAPSPIVTKPRRGWDNWWALGFWLAGAAALSIFLLISHLRLSRAITAQRPLIDPELMNLLEDCKQHMRVKVPVTLIESQEVGSPALFGFVRPRLLLPAGLRQSFSLDELRYVFLHELGHVKRHDILIGWLITGLQILHWFNPLVWFAFHRLRVDRELACDALALSFVKDEENQRYGNTIIKLLVSFGRPTWAPNLAGAVENRNQIKERITMIAKYQKTNRGLALVAALFAGLGLTTLTDAQPGATAPDNDLIGTWVLVGSSGETGGIPAVGGRFKFLTGTQWCITQADPVSSVVIFHHGGSYILSGNEYVETNEYANSSTKDRIGKIGKYTVKVEGDTLTQIGINNSRKEVWKRVKSGSIKPRKSDPSILQGTWRGQESGTTETGAASLVIRGTNLEFHGADTNEWYKATFTLFDTTPMQLVTVITACPEPQYVGMTSYAVCRIQDGTLTVTGNQPGIPVVPGGFDSPGARKFVFKSK